MRDLHLPGGGPSRMTWRRLRVLIEGLPPESATWTAIRNATPEDKLDAAAVEARPELGRWSQLEMLVAQLIDAVNRNTDTFIAANSEQNARPEPTDLVRRPGWKPRRGPERQPPTEAAQARLREMLAATS